MNQTLPPSHRGAPAIQCIKGQLVALSTVGERLKDCGSADVSDSPYASYSARMPTLAPLQLLLLEALLLRGCHLLCPQSCAVFACHGLEAWRGHPRRLSATSLLHDSNGDLRARAERGIER